MNITLKMFLTFKNQQLIVFINIIIYDIVPVFLIFLAAILLILLF